MEVKVTVEGHRADAVVKIQTAWVMQVVSAEVQVDP